MTRSERRAAERLARKTSRTQATAAPEVHPSPEPVAAPATPSARTNTNSSTGPTSAAGKARVSLNALKTGLTGHTVLLPLDDAALYESHVLAYQKDFQPVGPEETHLLQSIIDTRWRLARIPGLEYALLAVGRDKLAQEDPQFVESTSPLAVELRIRQDHEKQLRNLQLQENRLVRRREKEMKELRTLQATRKTEEAKSQEEEAKATKAKPAAPAAPQPKPREFEFSTPQSAQPTTSAATPQPAAQSETEQETEAFAA